MFDTKSLLILLWVSFAAGNGTIYKTLRQLSSFEELAEKLEELLIRKDISFTEECSKQLNEYSNGLRTFQDWAMHMFDSASKIPVGILNQADGDLGVFDECMKVEADTEVGTINGKYCLGKILFEEHQALYLNDSSNEFDVNYLRTRMTVLGIQVATCLPHACSTSDIQKLYSLLGINYQIVDLNCQSKANKPELDGLAIFGMVFFGTIVLLMTISTIYDVYNYYYKRKPLHKLLVAYSVFTNGRKLFSTSYESSQLTCLHGIRVFTTASVILYHRVHFTVTQVLIINRLDVNEWPQQLFSWQIIGGYMYCNSFLVMSGLTITYCFSCAMVKSGKFNVFRHYCHRYLRLTPPLAAATLLAASLIKHLGSGPQWPIMLATLENNCKNYWWSSLLYIQNYLNPTNICIMQTWYLSVDTQLFIFSPILLIVFHKWPKLRVYVLGTIIICLPIIPFMISWNGEYRLFMENDAKRYLELLTKLYYPTHARAIPWFIGLAAGYVVYETKNAKYNFSLKDKRKKLAFFAYWVLTLTVLYTSIVIYCYIPMKTEYNRVIRSLHAALISPIWCLGVVCLIIPCVNGYGGIINWILSNAFMQILSKLSYSMFLLHIMVIYTQIYSLRTITQFDDFEMLYIFWSDFMYSAIVSVFWVLAFEYPFVVIEEVLWPRKTGKAPVKSAEENDSAVIKEAY